MYSLPSEENVIECVINEDTVKKKSAPQLIKAKEMEEKTA